MTDLTFKDSLKVRALKWEKGGEGLGLLLLGVGEDELAYLTNTLWFKEHVLRANETNSDGAILASLGSILRSVSVRKDINLADFIDPLR